MLLSLDPHRLQPRKLEQAANIIRSGGILCYPTDTGYGFGCDPHQKKAVERLRVLTNRSSKKPATLVCKDFKQLAQYGYIRNAHFRLLRRIIPGPYTMVLEATKELPKHLQGKKKEVGVRVPEHSVVQGLLEVLDTPICNISAQDRHGEYVDDPLQIDDIYGKQIDLVLDCDLVFENPSTVVDLRQDIPEILREGQGDPDVFYQG